MDVISALAVANTAIKTVRSIAATSKNARTGAAEVYRELGKYADAVEDVKEWLGGKERKPNIFKQLSFKGSPTKIALSELATRERIKNLEKELRHMFYWGELSHLSGDGYKQFLSIRRSIETKRIRMQQELIERRKLFIRNASLTSLIIFMVGVLIYLVKFLLEAING